MSVGKTTSCTSELNPRHNIRQTSLMKPITLYCQVNPYPGVDWWTSLSIKENGNHIEIWSNAESLDKPILHSDFPWANDWRRIVLEITALSDAVFEAMDHLVRLRGSLKDIPMYTRRTSVYYLSSS